MTFGPDQRKSGANGDAASEAFGQLHEKVQRWIWKQGWAELRDIQERSIPLLIGANKDLIIAASTASGKTEAAFLPIVSRLAWDQEDALPGFGAAYISPLRALINDQFGRLESLCEELDIPVVKWHGDVSASVKQRARTKPKGILLITPESVEAMLVRRGPEAKRIFGNLRYIVVDELHAFTGSPRGKQLQSLLHRIETVAGRRIPRIGLSATLADLRYSAAFLRPLDPDNVNILESKSSGRELKLQLRGYVDSVLKVRDDQEEGADQDEGDSPAEGAVARHLFDTLRGKRSLIFAGARRKVELFTAKLNKLTEEALVPEEFFAHHGSLSREYREHAESRMKDEQRPASVVCTTTLELGIDIGHIDSVAQIGPGQTVSGMRQRLGRSGRRPGKPSIMRIYVEEVEVSHNIHPLDALRRETIQAIAMVNLMLAKWNEPPRAGRLHLSTLMHQILALIVQYGGVTSKQVWNLLVESGVFDGITLDIFKAVLRRMADPEVRLIEQAADGTLLPGEIGERIAEARDFYAVFKTPEEYHVVTDRGRQLGALPLESSYQPGQLMIFGGRRWRILNIDPERKEIFVTPARGGRPPTFGGTPVPPADGVIQEMLRVYRDIQIPPYLDETASLFLTEAREHFDRYGLRQLAHYQYGDMLLLFPWAGPEAQEALLLSLIDAELEPMPMGLAIGVPAKHKIQLRRALERLAAAPPPNAVDLAHLIVEKKQDKYDWLLSDSLLSEGRAPDLAVERVPCLASNLARSLAHRAT